LLVSGCAHHRYPPNQIAIGSVEGESTRLTLEVDTMERDSEAVYARIHVYGRKGKIESLVMVTGCPEGHGELVTRVPPDGEPRIFAWSSEGDRVYDGVAQAVCRHAPPPPRPSPPTSTARRAV
jgi:hypothetical protein